MNFIKLKDKILTTIENKLVLVDNVTKEYVDKVIADLINAAPEHLDTLKELADAIENNEDVLEVLISFKETLSNISNGIGKGSIQAVQSIATGANSSSFGVDKIVQNEDESYNYDVSFTMMDGTQQSEDYPNSDTPTTPGGEDPIQTTDPEYYIDGTQRNAIMNINFNTTGAKGVRSHSEGNNTLAAGEGSHSEGCNTFAKSRHSHAEGCKNYAEGVESHAEGLNNTAKGQASHTEGMLNISNGKGSHTEGLKNRTDGSYAHAEGSCNYSTSGASHVEGYNNYVSGNSAHAEGCNNMVYSHNAHVEGNSNIVEGINAHAEGDSNKKVKGNNAHAEGYNNEVEGNNSHVEGAGNKVYASASHAEGYGNTIQSGASCGHIEGSANIIYEGHYDSHVGGSGNRTSAPRQNVIGQYNVDNQNALFIVGNGKSSTDRSNAFAVLKDGRAILGKNPTSPLEAATKEYVDNAISSIPKFNIQPVTTLPTSNISTTTVYLLQTNSETSNLYEEYIYVNNKWELLGTAKVDLSDYSTIEQMETYANTKVPIINTLDGVLQPNIAGKTNWNLWDTFVFTYSPNAKNASGNLIYGGVPKLMKVSQGWDPASANSTNGLTIVQRTATGTIATAHPIANNDAATKKYVDDLVGNIQTLLEAI